MEFVGIYEEHVFSSVRGIYPYKPIRVIEHNGGADYLAIRFHPNTGIFREIEKLFPIYNMPGYAIKFANCATIELHNHLENSIVSIPMGTWLLRTPEGINGECFTRSHEIMTTRFSWQPHTEDEGDNVT